MKKAFLSTLIFFFSLTVNAQYAPPVGVAGCTAIYKDSSIIVNWVSECKIVRGYQDISQPGLGLANVGDSTMVPGPAQSNGVVSLGDGGSAICTFPYPISNGQGPDFVVFENGFNDTFLELAFVEVSSDGIYFRRFRSHSLTDTTVQISNNAVMDATKINNLAGKYRAGYGTPFDLQELSGDSLLDINKITHIKVKDVIGSIQEGYFSRDGFGNKINDPWPTGFPSGGFDLDAIGVINQNIGNGVKENGEVVFKIFPNPCVIGSIVRIANAGDLKSVCLSSITGSLIYPELNNGSFEVPAIAPGIYLLQINKADKKIYSKLLVTE